MRHHPMAPRAKTRVMAVGGQGRLGQDAPLLAELVARGCKAAGADVISATWRGAQSRKGQAQPVAVLPPTNKAASVCAPRGVPATTIHRILYTPVLLNTTRVSKKVAEWLPGNARPRDRRR